MKENFGEVALKKFDYFCNKKLVRRSFMKFLTLIMFLGVWGVVEVVDRSKVLLFSSNDYLLEYWPPKKTLKSLMLK